MNCPIWISKEVMPLNWYWRRKPQPITVRQQCGNPAREYLVSGESYSVTQVMCEFHARAAQAEGLKVVETSVDKFDKSAVNTETTV